MTRDRKYSLYTTLQPTSFYCIYSDVLLNVNQIRQFLRKKRKYYTQKFDLKIFAGRHELVKSCKGVYRGNSQATELPYIVKLNAVINYIYSSKIK